MAIEKKPEQFVLSGEEARQAIIEGVQRKLGKRIDEKTMLVTQGALESSPPVEQITITVDAIGGLKGVKPGTKRGPRKPKAVPAA